MSLFGSIKDHILIGGPNAVSGWGHGMANLGTRSVDALSVCYSLWIS